MTSNKTTPIELLRPHRHAGRDYKPGAVLRLRPDQAEWLTAIGVGREVSETPAPAAPKTPATTTTKDKE